MDYSETTNSARYSQAHRCQPVGSRGRLFFYEYHPADAQVEALGVLFYVFSQIFAFALKKKHR